MGVLLGLLSMAEADFGLKPLGVNFPPILGNWGFSKEISPWVVNLGSGTFSLFVGLTVQLKPFGN